MVVECREIGDIRYGPTAGSDGDDSEELRLAVDALQPMDAGIGESYPCAGDEVSDCSGHQELARWKRRR